MKRKSAYITILSVVLAVLFAVQPTAKAASETAENHKEYISEVKIGVGKTATEASSSLAGYTILSDNGKYVDLNQDAGGGLGSDGERVVYLGYKTTAERREAITDLAVMNMKGGYSVKDYELLMEQYVTEQIIPIVEKLLSGIREYRYNYNSQDNKNWQRALYVHSALNKLTDDDCYDIGLGDLFLSETKYEMGDEAYNALSEYEKKTHADIVTIVAQANGKALMMMQRLLMKAADTNEETWIDRFTATSYDDLLALYPDMLPSDAANELAKEYDDDAKELLSMWSAFQEEIKDAEKKSEKFAELSAKDLSKEKSIIENYSAENATEEQAAAYAEAYAEVQATSDAIASLRSDIMIKEYLDMVEYKDGHLTDFFDKKYETVKDDITLLYPLAASLSDGQRAGLQFSSLSDLIMIAATNGEGYKAADIETLEKASIYENVDREIYKPGGVALTNDALRAHAAEQVIDQGGKFSTLTYVMMGISAASAVAFGFSLYNYASSMFDVVEYAEYLKDLNNEIKQTPVLIEQYKSTLQMVAEGVNKDGIVMDMTFTGKALEKAQMSLPENVAKLTDELQSGTAAKLSARSAFCTKLMIGMGAAMIVFSAVTLFLAYRDLYSYYEVDYTPIPRYIVDEKDITAYNGKGEKTVVKNLTAYYKAVECNRGEDDEWYDILGTSADLNGTAGRQWLALYAAKNENESPILASSLKAVTDSDKVPADYTKGIHMFGSEAAYNLNNTQFVWNNEAPGVFVYYGVDTSPAGSPTSGSSFTAGYLILAAAGGLIVGAAAAAVVTLAVKKKKAEA